MILKHRENFSSLFSKVQLLLPLWKETICRILSMERWKTMWIGPNKIHLRPQNNQGKKDRDEWRAHWITTLEGKRVGWKRIAGRVKEQVAVSYWLKMYKRVQARHKGYRFSWIMWAKSLTDCGEYLAKGYVLLSCKRICSPVIDFTSYHMPRLFHIFIFCQYLRM